MQGALGPQVGLASRLAQGEPAWHFRLVFPGYRSGPLQVWVTVWVGPAEMAARVPWSPLRLPWDGCSPSAPL